MNLLRLILDRARFISGIINSWLIPYGELWVPLAQYAEPVLPEWFQPSTPQTPLPAKRQWRRERPITPEPPPKFLIPFRHVDPEHTDPFSLLCQALRRPVPADIPREDDNFETDDLLRVYCNNCHGSHIASLSTGAQLVTYAGGTGYTHLASYCPSDRCSPLTPDTRRMSKLSTNHPLADQCHRLTQQPACYFGGILLWKALTQGKIPIVLAPMPVPNAVKLAYCLQSPFSRPSHTGHIQRLILRRALNQQRPTH